MTVPDIKSIKHWERCNPFRILRAQENACSLDEAHGPLAPHFSVAALWYSDPPEAWTKDYYVIGRLPGIQGIIVYSTCRDQDYWMMEARLRGADRTWKTRYIQYKSGAKRRKNPNKSRPGKLTLDDYHKVLSLREQGMTLRQIAAEIGATSPTVARMIYNGPAQYMLPKEEEPAE